MKEKAFIIPATLLMLTLILILVSPIQDSLILSLRSKAEKSLAEQAKNQADNNILNNAISYLAPPATREINKGFTETVLISRISLGRNFSASFHNMPETLMNKAIIDNRIYVGPQNFPSLDYDRLFQNSISCATFGGQQILPFALTLSSKSAFSNQFCLFNSDRISRTQTLAANLKIISQTSLARDTTLAVKGFLLANARIELQSGPHNIISAGDLFIDELAALAPCEITLISASGDVKINKISGPLTLRVYAKNKAIIPSGAKYFTRGFEDLWLDFLPIGFD